MGSITSVDKLKKWSSLQACSDNSSRNGARRMDSR